MIQIRVNHEMFAYDAYHIVKAFYPGIKVAQAIDPGFSYVLEILADGCVPEHLMTGEKNGHTLPYAGSVAPPAGHALTSGKETADNERTRYVIRSEDIAGCDRKSAKHKVSRMVYERLSRITGKTLPWGILTGVRPTKPVLGMLEDGVTDDKIMSWMRDELLVSKEKASLALKVAKKERSILRRLDYRDGYSLYAGIPFCPTTCSYCSFTSYPIAGWEKRTDEYLDALCKELSLIASDYGKKKLNAIYIGGGTPTTLSAGQLGRLLDFLETRFSFGNLLEFTVEAGRADSITKEKLRVLSEHPVSRISINPQTMRQKTLDIIGRRHTPEDVRRAFGMAREMGFDNINMDIIAGLPDETTEDMQETLEQIRILGPDSLTVHALAGKRASRLTRERTGDEADPAEEARYFDTVSRMISLGGLYAKDMGLSPYYLYRQKNIAGNFENVGYALPGKEGIYNILIMEERQSVPAAGAGATTKILLTDKDALPNEKTGEKKRILRFANTKDVGQYIEIMKGNTAGKA